MLNFVNINERHYEYYMTKKINDMIIRIMNNIVELIPEADLEKVREFSLENLETSGRVSSCYDGDSARIVFAHEGSIFRWTCRLFGIDTPEIRTKNPKEKELAYKAKEALENMTIGKKIKVRCHEIDKYGRVLVTLTDEDGLNISDKLIEQGLGRAYFGGKKQPWFIE
jgi:micrococcal nuclease